MAEPKLRKANITLRELRELEKAFEFSMNDIHNSERPLLTVRLQHAIRSVVYQIENEL